MASLAEALAARKSIERAKGLLMQREGLTEGDAFARLRGASQRSGQPMKLIYERSQPGRIGYRLPPLDVDEQPIGEIVPQEFLRDDDLEGVPEVSEVDVIRHFVRMSTWNYSIDQGMYPLGSCTMKYNSRLNEKVAHSRLRGTSPSKRS